MDQLPVELQNMLTEFLDVVSLVRMGRVSKKWQTIVRSSSAWKNLYEEKFGNWEYPGAPFPVNDWLLKYQYASEINDIVVDVVPEANPSKEKLDFLIKKNKIRPSAFLTLIIAGGGAVGCSAMLIQFLFHRMVERYDPTIADDYYMVAKLNGNKFLVRIIDTAGQEEYEGLRGQLMKAADGFLLVYSLISGIDTAAQFKQHVQKMKKYSTESKFPLVLCGNKCDLDKERVISEKQGQKLAKAWGCPFFEVSAKNGKNIQLAFATLLKSCENLEQCRNLTPKSRRKKLCRLQ